MNAIAFLLMLAIFAALAWWYIENSDNPDKAGLGLFALRPDNEDRKAPGKTRKKARDSDMQLARIREKAAASQAKADPEIREKPHPARDGHRPKGRDG